MSPNLAAPFVPAKITPVSAHPNPVDAQAKAAGYAQGFNQGAAQAAAEAEDRARQHIAEHEALMAQVRSAADQGIAALASAASAVSAVEVATVEQARAELHAAAVELAEAILGRELSTATDSARVALERVAASPVAGKVIEVRLHPDEHAAATTLVEQGTAPLPAQATLVADPTLTPGQVIATYPNGHLDASIATALDRARAAVNGGDL